MKEEMDKLQSILQAMRKNIEEKNKFLDMYAIENVELRQTIKKLKEIIKRQAD